MHVLEDGVESLTTTADNSDLSSETPDMYDWTESMAEIEQLSHELANKGPAQSAVELR